MEFFEIVDTRKTIRKYGDYKPTIDEAKRIIESARLAPSAMNAQNWRFLAVYNDEIKNEMVQAVLDKYDEIITRVDSEAAGYLEGYKRHATFFNKAPLLIVCVEQESKSPMAQIIERAGYSESEIKMMRPNSFALSMGGAVENMSLSAKALGLGSCWLAAPVLAYEKMGKILNLKEGERVVSLLTVGKPFEENDKRAAKKTLEEIIEIIE